MDEANKILDFLAALRARGVQLRVEDENIHYRSLEGTLTNLDIEILRQRKAEILKILNTGRFPSVDDDDLKYCPQPWPAPVRHCYVPATLFQSSFVEAYESLFDPLYLHVWFAIRTSRIPDVGLLREIVRMLVKRHEVLRSTCVRRADGKIEFHISEGMDIEIEEVSANDFPHLQSEADLPQLVAAYARKRFDLSAGPLLRIGIVKRTRSDLAVVLVVHHCICDGQSLSILSAEMTAISAALSAGVVPELPRLPGRYADFVMSQRCWLETPEAARRLEYWRSRLANIVFPCQLPIDRKPPVDLWAKHFRTDGSVPETVVAAIHRLSRLESTSPFIVVLTCFAVLLHAWSERSDALMWVCHAGRRQPQLINIVGCFLDMWPLRTHIEKDMAFLSVMRAVRDAYIEALPHLDIPGLLILQKLPKAAREASIPMSFFNFLPLDWASREQTVSSRTIGGAPSDSIEIMQDGSIPDNGYLDPECGNSFNINVYDRTDSIRWIIRHNPALFEDETIAEMSKHLSRVLTQVSINPNVYVSQLNR